MKKYIGILSIGAALMGGMSSCNDFLDREPLDKVTPEVYFNSPDDLAAYCIKCYSFKTVDEKYGINLFGTDNHTDNQAGTGIPTFWIPGKKLVASDAGEWKWEEIRACNYFFDNVLPKYENGEFEGDANVQKLITHYIGEMYVLRAYKYFVMMQKFGDLPIVETAMQPDKEQLLEASKRRPRHKVARFIIEDLKKAEKMLMETPPGGKNRISRDVAYLLHSRVALYEGTWEKYHAGTAFVPGGKGWPGKDAEGYVAETEINYFLDEAIAASKVVGDKMMEKKLTLNTCTKEGMDPSYVSINPYYTMFCDENMEDYAEVLMWKRFDKGQGVINNLQMELMRNGGDSGWTLGMVNSFLMKNGLPFYAQGSLYNENCEDKGVNAALAERDSRIQIFTKKPRDIEAKEYKESSEEDKKTYTVTKADTLSYGDVNYYTAAGKADTCVIDYLFGNAGTAATTGFIVKKGKHYNVVMADHDMGTSGGIVFRGAEALLNYMEAYFERYNTINDKDGLVRAYWEALRVRANITPETIDNTINATVMTEEAKWDWAAYSKNQLVDPTLYNIRRERRNELCAEGFRMDDLKRWRALDQMISTPYRVRGMKFWNTIYSANKELMGKCKVDPKEGNMSSEDLGDYILPYFKVTENNTIADNGGFLFTPAHYLEPIGMAAFRQTAVDSNDFYSSVIYQNPGWKIEANTGAFSVK